MTTGMTARQARWLKLTGAGLLALVTAAAFSAYLKPGMLVEFANMVLCT